MANYKDGVGNYKGGQSGVTTAIEIDTLTSTFSTTSTSIIDITGLSIVIPNQSGGTTTLVFNVSNYHSTTGENHHVIDDDGSDVKHMTAIFGGGGGGTDVNETTAYYPMASDGSTIKGRGRVNTGTGFWLGDASNDTSLSAVSIY